MKRYTRRGMDQLRRRRRRPEGGAAGAGYSGTQRALQATRDRLSPRAWIRTILSRAQGAQASERCASMGAVEYRLLRARDGLDLTTQDGHDAIRAERPAPILRGVKNPVEAGKLPAPSGQRDRLRPRNTGPADRRHCRRERRRKAAPARPAPRDSAERRRQRGRRPGHAAGQGAASLPKTVRPGGF